MHLKKQNDLVTLVYSFCAKKVIDAAITAVLIAIDCMLYALATHP